VAPQYGFLTKAACANSGSIAPTSGTNINSDDSGITPLSQQLNGPSYSRTHLTSEGLSQYSGRCATSFSRVLSGRLLSPWLPGTASDLSGGECNVDRTTDQRRFQ
jgi:hypothetical protein